MRDTLIQAFGLKRLMNLWPPLLGAGIRVTRISPDVREIDVELRLTRLNRNYVGTHFGGSLFAMTDPFYMLMLKHALGDNYVVWDKAGSIRFKRPGLTSVHAHFSLTAERLAEIRTALDRDGIYEPTFTVEILDPANQVISTVERLIYCATKEAHTARQQARKPS